MGKRAQSRRNLYELRFAGESFGHYEDLPDSTLPELFLPQLASIVRQISDREEIAGVVPHVVSREHFISPHLLKRGRSVRLPKGFAGVAEGEVSAINSGMTWRTTVLREIGGFNVLFWLDYLDHWLFREVRQSWKTYLCCGRYSGRERIIIAESQRSIKL